MIRRRFPDGLSRGHAATRLAIFVVCMLLSQGCLGTPLTEAEKQLLQNSMSVTEAETLGSRGDAEGIKKIIALGDASLVRRFGVGMMDADITILPNDVERVVVANFDHPTLGMALRDMRSRYQTRPMFELHLARIKAAYALNEPSLYLIFNTDLSGIEAPLISISTKYPSGNGIPNAVTMFLGARRYPPAVPMLIAAIPDGYNPPSQHNPVLDRLQAYPSVEVWKTARDGIESLHRAGKIAMENYTAAAKRFDMLIANAVGTSSTISTLAAAVKAKNREAYTRKLEAIQPGYKFIAKFQNIDSRKFADELGRYLEKVEPLAIELADSSTLWDLARVYYALGMTLRFHLGEPAAAAGAFMKASEHGIWQGLLAAADTYQFALGDKVKAIAAYQRTLDGPRPAMRDEADWYRLWLPGEIRFLRTGARFAGSMSETEVAGFFESAGYGDPAFSRNYGIGEIVRDLPDVQWLGAGVKNWPDLATAVAKQDRSQLAAKLDAMPASRLVLRAALRHISLLPDADSILRQLRKHDPSGYWSTPILAAALSVTQNGDQAKTAALRNGIAAGLPGLASASTGKAVPLAAAASTFMHERKLSLVPKPAER